MRLYSGKIPAIAQEIAKALDAAEAIDTEAPKEVAADLEAVLKEYLRNEREITDEAKARMEHKGLNYSLLSKVRAQVAAGADAGSRLGRRAAPRGDDDPRSRAAAPAVAAARGAGATDTLGSRSPALGGRGQWAWDVQLFCYSGVHTLGGLYRRCWSMAVCSGKPAIC